MFNHSNHVERNEERILTAERAMTTNSRETNNTRIILFRLNTAYALEPHTAIRREKRVSKVKKRWTPVKLIKRNESHSLTMPIRPNTLKIAQIRYPASQLQIQNYRCQARNIVKKGIVSKAKLLSHKWNLIQQLFPTLPKHTLIVGSFFANAKVYNTLATIA